MRELFSVIEMPEPDYRTEAVEDTWRIAGIEGDYRNVPAWSEPVSSWYYLYGEIGSGKTYRAVSMLRRFLEDHTHQRSGCPIWFTPTVKFVKAPLYLEAVKSRYTDANDVRPDVYQNCDLLVLDDLGQEAATPWAFEQLFLLIDHRYNLKKPVIITSQLDLVQMSDRIAENAGRQKADAITSRLLHYSQVQRVEGQDRRIAMRAVS